MCLRHGNNSQIISVHLSAMCYYEYDISQKPVHYLRE